MTCHKTHALWVVVCFLVTICSAERSDCIDTWKNCWNTLLSDISKCNESFYERNCKKTCGLCSVCRDSRNDCSQINHSCNENYMQLVCRKTCSACVVMVTEERYRYSTTTHSTTPTRSADACLLLPDSGSCTDLFPRWYYHAPHGECRLFNYSGCGGNNNHFETEDDCNTFCSSGAWSDWNDWSACSATCGAGTISRQRTCSPLHALCNGSAMETEQCNLSPCCDPLNGQWQRWGGWSECSQTCEKGFRRRTRICSQHNTCGRSCEGKYFEDKECNRGPCSNEPAVPVIASIPGKPLFAAGDKATFTCSSSDLGNPPGTLTWEVSGLDARTTALSDGRIQLEINNVSAEDDGLTVTCRVTNDMLQKQASAVLRVEQRAVLGECKVSLNSATWTITGYCDVIKVYASNTGHYGCQWVKQKRHDPRENVPSSLNLTSVSPGRKLQAGKCSFEEKFPRDFPWYSEKSRQIMYKMYALPGTTWSDAITVSVVSPVTPTLTCPTDVLPAGTRLVCTCNTTGLGAPQGRLLLFFNNHLVGTGNYGQNVITLSRDLRRQDDKARVRCLLDWAKNISDQRTQIVKVLYAPAKPTLTLTKSTVKAEDYAGFLCEVDGGYGLSLDLVKVTSNGTWLISSSNTERLFFSLHNAKCEDTGNYCCQAKNSVGQANSTLTQLFVLCSPQPLGTTRTTNQVEVTKGSSGLFSFEITAHPVPTIDSFIYLSGGATSSSKQEPVRSGLLFGQCERHGLDLHLVTCTLTITAPTSKDSGIYNGKVSNSLGTTNFAFELRVINQDSAESSTSTPWIGVLVGLPLVALIAFLIAFVVKRRKGALSKKTDKKRILSDTGISPEGLTYYNVAEDALTSQPAVGHVTSENVVILETVPLSQNREESNASRATKENFQCDVYAVVNKTRKTSSDENAGKPSKPARSSKPLQTGSLSPRPEKGCGEALSGQLSVQNTEGENVFDNNVNAAAITLETANKEGLVYADLDFSQYQPDRQRPLPQKQETNYAAIDFSKVGGGGWELRS